MRPDRLFERVADAYGRDIRYGGEPLPDLVTDPYGTGRKQSVDTMLDLSSLIAKIEGFWNEYETWPPSPPSEMETWKTSSQDLVDAVDRLLDETRSLLERLDHEVRRTTP